MLLLRRCLGGRECLEVLEAPEAPKAPKAAECSGVLEGLGTVPIAFAVAFACCVGGNGSGTWKFTC